MRSTLQKELEVRRREVQSRLRKNQAEIHAFEDQSMGTEMAAVGQLPPSQTSLEHLRQVQRSIAQQVRVIDAEIEADRERLRRLRFWLTIETIGGVSTVVLAKGSVYLLLGLGLPFIWWYALLILAALAFTPFLLTTIIRTRRFGWLITFVLMVCVPCLLVFVPVEDPRLALAFQLFPLLTFYVYCWLLRHAVDDWLEN